MSNPFSRLVTNTSKEKEIFYFSSDKLNTKEPHFFVLIKKNAGEVLVFTCCTTQLEKRENYILMKGYSMKTLVVVDPTPENGLKERTLIDCNTIFAYTIEEFKELVESGAVTYKGEISEEHYEQILIGLQESKEISEEDKESLPKP